MASRITALAASREKSPPQKRLRLHHASCVSRSNDSLDTSSATYRLYDTFSSLLYCCARFRNSFAKRELVSFSQVRRLAAKPTIPFAWSGEANTEAMLRNASGRPPQNCMTCSSASSCCTSAVASASLVCLAYSAMKHSCACSGSSFFNVMDVKFTVWSAGCCRVVTITRVLPPVKEPSRVVSGSSLPGVPPRCRSSALSSTNRVPSHHGSALSLCLSSFWTCSR
mmetsp:Transcript_2374/g.8490  ORF Transcript_2374/g.8490 Transcript_2374/m.8490 type:complete len:225 (+) Transcript_2374:556-1230(+)